VKGTYSVKKNSPFVLPQESCKVKQCFTEHAGSNLERLAGTYTMIVILHNNSFDRKDLSLVDSHKLKEAQKDANVIKSTAS
jgi:hypothetical protein